MEITVKGCGYARVIQSFLSQSLVANLNNPCEVLEALTNAILASSQVRYGPKPLPEGLVRIRSVIRKSIENNLPIPILMPWGTKKPDNNRTIDVAEVSGLQQIIALNERITQFYEPGMVMNVRVEDTSGFWLFERDGQEAITASRRYIADFDKLVNIMEAPVSLMYESAMMDSEEFNILAETYRRLFYDYLWDSDSLGFSPDLRSFKALQDVGWLGEIPTEQREFYYSRYRRVHDDRVYITDQTARYFAAVLARKKLNGYGQPILQDDYIQVSFAPPVPGTPRVLADRIVNYRTVLMKHARTHIPPWRARGYLRVSSDKVTPKIQNYLDSLDDVHSAEVTFARDGMELTIPIEHTIID